MRFSYSQVHLYEQNPWKHFCNYVLGLYPPSSEQADRGTDVHSLFEHLAKNANTIKDGYVKYLDELKDDPEMNISNEVYTIVRRYLVNYAGESKGLLSENRLPWKDAKSIECEKKILIDIEGVPFVGYIDLVVYHDDGSVSLYDYKTLSNKPSVNEYVYGMQGNLYMYAMKKLGFKVRKFIFDAINPKMEIPWNNYKFFRIELMDEPNRIDTSVKRFVHLSKEITKNPSYYNTFNGWTDELHNDAWKQFTKSPERLYYFLVSQGINVESKLSEALAKGYPIPYFFIMDDVVESSDEEPTENVNGVRILKKDIGNRKYLENWTDSDIRQDGDEQFDYLVLCNYRGYKVFTSDYTEIFDFSKEEIESLEFGMNVLDIKLGEI